MPTFEPSSRFCLLFFLSLFGLWFKWRRQVVGGMKQIVAFRSNEALSNLFAT